MATRLGGSPERPHRTGNVRFCAPPRLASGPRLATDRSGGRKRIRTAAKGGQRLPQGHNPLTYMEIFLLSSQADNNETSWATARKSTGRASSGVESRSPNGVQSVKNGARGVHRRPNHPPLTLAFSVAMPVSC